MRVSEKWLREWVNPEIDTNALAEKLSMSGLEVASIEKAAPDFSGVVVGHVIKKEKHPDADKLNLCQVDVGESEPLSIICGAPNVRENLHVAVARIGAVLPGNFKIKKAKLRGIASHGMICSKRELGLGDEHDGIMELSDDAPIGADCRDYYQLDDAIFDIEITPNRGDCLSISGIARDVSALTTANLKPFLDKTVPPHQDNHFPIEIKAPDACPHYVGRVICGINPNAVTPLWMSERLRRSGIRSIHPVVDVTNYVMLELGQPMHAFDLSKLADAVQVRYAKKDETITLLDDAEITLDDQTLVIADSEKVLAIAGVMGGKASGVDHQTVDILLESAYFSKASIWRTTQQYGIHTDSAYRFERGVDFKLQVCAMERATELLLDIVGGKAAQVISVLKEKHLPKSPNIFLKETAIKRLLGISISSPDIESILTHLGFSIESVQDGWQVTVPTFRSDIMQEADLIEEIARIHGYDKIPTTPAMMHADICAESGVVLSNIALKHHFVSKGYREVITYSFVDKNKQSLLFPNCSCVALSNPISSEMNVMRVSLITGLLDAARYNLNRQIDRLRLFELGQCFYERENQLIQQSKLAGLISGAILPKQWSEKERSGDFYDVKGDIESLFSDTIRDSLSWERATVSYLHPGQAASIEKNGKSIGYLGALHPSILDAFDLKQSIYVFELDLDGIKESSLPECQMVSKFPSVRRDIAIIVDCSIPVQTICKKIRTFCNQWLRKVEIFDIYQGAGVKVGMQSIAMALTFTRPNKTLSDTDVNTLMENIIAMVKDEFNATLRA